MEWLTLLSVLENLVFYGLVIFIAYRKHTTPTWGYVFLSFFLIYWMARSLVMNPGMESALTLYAVNLFIVLFLFGYFMYKN